MKKALSIVLVLCLMLCSFTVIASAEDVAVTTYHFGGTEAIDGQDGTAQGQNGWYYMWSPETNKGGNLDVSQIKESVYSDCGSCMAAWYGNVWVPDIYTADDYDCWANNNWWYQTVDGTNSPAVVDGDMATAIIGFKAPEAGEYAFDFSALSGVKDDTSPEADGLTISINVAGKVLYSVDTPTDSKDTFENGVTVMLNKDEYIYFCADPKENGANEETSFEIEGVKIGKYVDNKTTWGFGTDTAIAGQDGSAQGQNGWYYMWSPETNTAGVYDVSKIKESVASETGSCWFAWWVGYVIDGSKGWIPEIYADDAYDCWANNNWWLQTPSGDLTPAAVDGDMASAIIGFKVPESGKYTVDLTAQAGSQNDTDPANDGVTVSVYGAGKKEFSKASSATTVDTIDNTYTAHYDKGDMIYLIVDPNSSAANDTANVKAYVTLVEKDAPEIIDGGSENGSGDVTDNNSNNNNTSTDTDNSSTSPQTGDIASESLIGILFVSAVVVFASRKKLSIK